MKCILFTDDPLMLSRSKGNAYMSCQHAISQKVRNLFKDNDCYITVFWIFRSEIGYWCGEKIHPHRSLNQML